MGHRDVVGIVEAVTDGPVVGSLRQSCLAQALNVADAVLRPQRPHYPVKIAKPQRGVDLAQADHRRPRFDHPIRKSIRNRRHPQCVPVRKCLRSFSAQFHDFRPVRAQISTARRRTLHIMVRVVRQGKEIARYSSSGRNSNAQNQFGRRNCVNARWCRSLGHLDHSGASRRASRRTDQSVTDHDARKAPAASTVANSWVTVMSSGLSKRSPTDRLSGHSGNPALRRLSM